MERTWCAYLAANVELTAERERHIAEEHPDLLPRYREEMLQVVGNPERIRGSGRSAGALLLSRWFADIRGGKHIVVVVRKDDTPVRHWIVTAYLARRVA